MHDQWYFSSVSIPEGLYLIEAVHSGKFITFTPERSTLVQQDQNIENDGESQVFEIQHLGYHDYLIRHHLTGLVLTVHNGSPSPCAPLILSRCLRPRTPYQTVNFERPDHQTNDLLIFLKHTRMVVEIDGGSHSSNARVLQFPQKKNLFDQTYQRFRLHRVADDQTHQSTIPIPEEFFR